MQNFFWTSTKKPIIALSPMADHTDAAFCLLVKELAPSTVVFREMVSAEAMIRGNEKTDQMAAIHEAERPLIQQIFGGDPEIMAAAAKLIEERHHPDGIDINMGCPAKKIVSNFNGAALMRQPELAAEIVGAVKAAARVPISVKTRLGWKNPEDCLSFAPLMEKAGADLISIHGRTKEQGFSGKADWKMIERVKKIVSIPVLGNGDITTVSQAMKALETGVDGLLIGRGALGNPWIFRDIEDALAGREPRKMEPHGQPPFARGELRRGYPPYSDIRPKSSQTGRRRITPAERAAVILRHAELFLKTSGREDLTNFRKHLVWYFKGMGGAAKIRSRISVLKNLEELEDYFNPSA